MELSWNCSASGEPQGPVCNWFGVGCDIDGVVTSLSLSDLYLTGTLPSSIGYLSGLQSLNLSENFLSGTIPSSVGYLTALQVMDLSFNHLVGTLPTSLSLLTGLVSLNLSVNALSGTMPISMQGMSHLESVQLYGNRLSGYVPPLCFPALRELYLYRTSYPGNTNMTCYYPCVLSVPQHDYGNLTDCSKGEFVYSTLCALL